MINTADILETINMIRQENLDIRTITMGISLFDCVSDDNKRLCANIYDKITGKAERLVKTGEEIEKEYGIPIVNKRVSVTPVSLIGGAHSEDTYIEIAKTLDNAAKTLGINFIGGYSALVEKGFTEGAKRMIGTIPEALACTGVNKGRHQHGRGEPDGAHHQKDRPAHQGRGFHRLRKARGVRQRTAG